MSKTIKTLTICLVLAGCSGSPVSHQEDASSTMSDASLPMEGPMIDLPDHDSDPYYYDAGPSFRVDAAVDTSYDAGSEMQDSGIIFEVDAGTLHHEDSGCRRTSDRHHHHGDKD